MTCVPDEARGERLVVLYVEAGWRSLHGCDVAGGSGSAGRGLPNLWVPSARGLLRRAELPHLGSGKVDLKRLKDMAVELARK